MKILQLVLAMYIIVLSQCKYGVDVSQLFSAQNFTCMKNNYNVSFGIARAYHSYGGLDVNAIQSITNMKNAGLKADIYMFPCRGKNATVQVDQLIKGIPTNLYTIIWLDIETNTSPGCSWNGHDSQSNCQFTLELLNQIRKKNIKVGIYTSKYMWGSIYKSYDACPQASVNVPLWYSHYDGIPSFSDFIPFAGWKTPAIKQYQGTSSLCGASVDRSWEP